MSLLELLNALCKSREKAAGPHPVRHLCQGTAPGYVPNQVKLGVYSKALGEYSQLKTVLQDTEL